MPFDRLRSMENQNAVETETVDRGIELFVALILTCTGIYLFYLWGTDTLPFLDRRHANNDHVVLTSLWSLTGILSLLILGMSLCIGALSGRFSLVGTLIAAIFVSVLGMFFWPVSHWLGSEILPHAGFAFSTYREQKQNEQLQKEFDVLIAKERVEATRQQAAKTEQMRDVREAKYVSNEARDHRLDSRLAVSATGAAAAARRCLPLK